MPKSLATHEPSRICHALHEALRVFGLDEQAACGGDMAQPSGGRGHRSSARHSLKALQHLARIGNA